MSRRGQVLPLACVSLLFMALTMMLSFNLTNVIHEKIRLQNYSDAQAYSMGVVEARTFNYLAYSNRASAAAFVSIASLHGFMAIASMSGNLMRASSIAMLMEGGLETAVCIATLGEKCCDHIAEPFQLANQYNQDAQDADDKIKDDWEGKFNDAVEALWKMVESIHTEQDDMIKSATTFLKSGFESGSLKATAAKNASPLAQGVGGLNEGNMTCTLEGSEYDSCDPKKSEDERAQIFTEIINASRPKFEHSVMQMGTDYAMMSGQKWSDLTLAMPFWMGGEHGLADSVCSPSAGDKGEKACGTASGGIFLGIKHDLPGVGPVSGSEVYSDDNGGGHTPDGAHDPDHDKFTGIPKCVQDKKCFVNFRAGDEDEGWGQPAVYGYYQLELNRRPNTKGYKQPWELGTDGKLTMDMGARKDGEEAILQMRPERTGSAASKALVYFHPPGKWSRPPNFFDPFWHTKLHPFTRDELARVIEQGGDGKGQDAEMARTVAEGESE